MLLILNKRNFLYSKYQKIKQIGLKESKFYNIQYINGIVFEKLYLFYYSFYYLYINNLKKKDKSQNIMIRFFLFLIGICILNIFSLVYRSYIK